MEKILTEGSLERILARSESAAARMDRSMARVDEALAEANVEAILREVRGVLQESRKVLAALKEEIRSYETGGYNPADQGTGGKSGQEDPNASERKSGA